MSRRGETPTPTPPTPDTNAITVLSVDGTSILAEGSTVNVTNTRPTIHIKAQRVSTDVNMEVSIKLPNQTALSTNFAFAAGELVFEGDILPNGLLTSGTNTIEMYIGGSIMPTQTCGSIVIS